MKTLFSVVFAFLFLFYFADEVYSQNDIQGYVYEELNQTGQRDDGDPGIVGVMVSNQLDLAISTFFERMRVEYDDKFPGWIQPIQTTHIWRADLPEGLGTGIHKLEIQTRDMFGQEFTQTKALEIVE